MPRVRQRSERRLRRKATIQLYKLLQEYHVNVDDLKPIVALYSREHRRLQTPAWVEGGQRRINLLIWFLRVYLAKSEAEKQEWIEYMEKKECASARRVTP